MKKFLEIIDHAGPVYDVIVDEDRLLSSGADRYVVSWDKVTGKQLPFACKLEKPAYKILVVGDYLFVGQIDGKLTVINLITNKEERVFDVHKRAIIDMSFNKGVLFVASQDGSISLWNATNLEFIRQLTIDGLRLRKIQLVPEKNLAFVIGQSGEVHGLELDYLNEVGTSKIICSDGLSTLWVDLKKEVILIGDKHGFITILSLNTELKEIYRFAAHKSAVYGLVLIGDVLVSGSRDKSIKTWRYSDLSPLDKLTGDKGHRYSVNGLVASGNLFYSWSDDGNILGFEKSC